MKLSCKKRVRSLVVSDFRSEIKVSRLAFGHYLYAEVSSLQKLPDEIHNVCEACDIVERVRVVLPLSLLSCES